MGVPTHAAELARQVSDLLAGGARGVAHAVGGGGPITWYAFAQEIVALSHSALRSGGMHQRGVPPARTEAPSRVAPQ